MSKVTMPEPHYEENEIPMYGQLDQDCYTAAQMEAYAAAKVQEALGQVDAQDIRDAALEEDDDDYPAGFSDWYNREFANQVADTKHMAHCEEAWRAALIRALKGGAV